MCEFENILQEDSSISIGGIGDEVAERPLDNVQGTKTGSKNTTVTKKTETKRTVTCNTLINTSLALGSSNSTNDMALLEDFLNTYQDEDLEVNGVFENEDERAVMRFQEKYRNIILTPLGLSEPTGNVYAATRNHINSLYCAYITVERN